MSVQKKKFERKTILISLIGLILYAAVTVIVIVIYKNANLTLNTNRWIQNCAYLCLAGVTLCLCKLSGCAFSDYGIRFTKIHRQLLIGVGIGAGLLLVQFVFGSVPSIPDNVIYVVFSQLLVGISEELFWRGFLLQNLCKITGSSDIAVGLTALLFALSHMPNHLSLGYFIFTFITGIVLAVLRTEFKASVGIPALAFGHALSNIF